MKRLHERIQKRIEEVIHQLDIRDDNARFADSGYEHDVLQAKLSMYRRAADYCKNADLTTDSAPDSIEVFRAQMEHDISYIRFSMKSWGIVIDENNKMYNSAKVEGSLQAYQDVIMMSGEMQDCKYKRRMKL